MTAPAWQAFVRAYGVRADAHELAHIVQQPVDAIHRYRRVAGACVPGKKRPFAELFALWHGRPPGDADWPPPRKVGGAEYGWQGPELTLLASLVGRMGTDEIVATLTKRLRQVTGDPTASRTRNSVWCRLQQLGLQTGDVLGGITVADAGRQINCTSILYTEIARGRLPSFRVGRLLVIPHAAFEAWKAGRVFPPQGFVPLATLKRPLGIRSDKLSEWARAGRVPTAVRCNPYGSHDRGTQFGTWYIDGAVAKRIVADRRAGRPMPWHGGFDQHNLRVTFRRWRARQHPASCADCRDIWGPDGPPATWDDYVRRYPPLARGAKRHLTRPYTEGLSLADVARLAGVSLTRVQLAVSNGVLRTHRIGRRHRLTRTDATRWKARKCPTGTSEKSWLALPTAAKQYGFSMAEIRGFIADGRLTRKVGTFGAQRGIQYVPRQACAELRETLGFTLAQAARRVGVSVPRMRVLLHKLAWRPAPAIPLRVVQAAIKREQSQEGVTLAEAARILRKPLAWVRQQLRDGTFRVARTEWTRSRLYVSMPMFKRLCEAALQRPRKRERWSREWLLLSDAGRLAGVCGAQIQRWSDRGEIAVRLRGRFRRYHRRSVLQRARRYWAHENRFRRKSAPAWLGRNPATDVGVAERRAAA